MKTKRKKNEGVVFEWEKVLKKMKATRGGGSKGCGIEDAIGHTTIAACRTQEGRVIYGGDVED